MIVGAQEGLQIQLRNFFIRENKTTFIVSGMPLKMTYDNITTIEECIKSDL